MKNTFWYTPLNSLSLITISLEKVQESGSFMLKRILKCAIIKMHSASFFINGLNGEYKLTRCVAYYISVEKTDNPVNTPYAYISPFRGTILECGLIEMFIGPLYYSYDIRSASQPFSICI